MKQTLCILAAGAALLTGLTGCSADEELSNVAQSASNEIRFNVVTTNPQTKAVIIDGTDQLKSHNIEVFAFKGSDYYMGKPGGDNSWKDHGVELTYQNSAWTYTDQNATYYWPHQEALDFYAVSPSEMITTSSFTGATITPGQKQFSCLMLDESQSGERNVDAMYATALNVTKDMTSNGSGTVSLHFKHALSQVVFQARKKDVSQNIAIEVEGITLFNVRNSGTFTFPTADQSNGTWSPRDISKTFYHLELDSDSPITIQTGDVTTLLSHQHPLLCIPQTLTPWNHSTSNPITGNDNLETDSGNNCFLRIKCKIHDGDHYFVGSSTAYGYTYVPFEANWIEGYRYIYTLYFGAGYNKDGSEIDIVPITFTAEATDWVDASNDITGF